MKVKDLIAELSIYDKDLDILIVTDKDVLEPHPMFIDKTETSEAFIAL